MNETSVSSATLTAPGQETRPIYIQGEFTVLAPASGLELHQRFRNEDGTTSNWIIVKEFDGDVKKFSGFEPGNTTEVKIVAGSSFSGSAYVRVEERF